MASTHRVTHDYERTTASENSNIRVYIRARPCDDGSAAGDFVKVSAEDKPRKISIRDPDEGRSKHGEVGFDFDRIFWTETPQEEVFEAMCKPQVDHVLQGFNCCCFAYGQTGSGKTYSMFGNDSEVRGIIPRAAEYLFASLAKKTATHEVGVVCSFLEVYNDAIRDLGKAHLVSIGADAAATTSATFSKTSDIFESLAGKRGNPHFAPAFHASPTKAGAAAAATAGGTLAGTAEDEHAQILGYKGVQEEYQAMNYEIREDAEGNVFVGNLSMVPVTTIDEVMAMIETGLKLRATHETKMNAASSRSHTVFTMSVLQRDKLTDVTIQGMLNLVDLAGSERLKKSESVGIRLKEALHINTSLSALGKVIMSLDPNSENTHIPYRDSKLTRLLQNSLGGNSYTIVLAAIHPHASHYEECLSTLQFANRCRNVKNNPKVNYVDDPSDKDMKIKRLTEEVAALRTKLASAEKGMSAEMVMRKGGKISPAKLVEILKRLGMNASLAADGGLLVNGERFEVDGLGLEEEQDDDDPSITGDDDSGLNFALSGKVNKKKIRMIVSELTEANRNHSVKSKERKVLMQEQGKQIEELSRQVSRLQLAAKHHEVAMAQLKEREDLRREEALKALEDVHRKELDKLMAQQEAAHKKEMEMFDKAPSTFKTYTALVKEQEAVKVNFEEPLRDEFRAQLKMMQDAAQTELTNVKKQYEYWLKEKETALEAFAEKFNVYRGKKTEQLKMCEAEIIKMYEYMVKTDDILDGVERGVYKVERYQGKHGRSTTGHAAAAATLNATMVATAQGTRRSLGQGVPDAAGLLAAVENPEDEHAIAGGKGRVLFPKGLRPKNPLKSSSDDMKLAKKIVEKYTQRKEKLDETKALHAKKTGTFATQLLDTTAGAAGNNNNDEDVDPYVEQHLRQLLGRIGAPVPPAKETSVDRPVSPDSGVTFGPTNAAGLQRPRPTTGDGAGAGGRPRLSVNVAGTDGSGREDRRVTNLKRVTSREALAAAMRAGAVVEAALGGGADTLSSVGSGSRRRGPSPPSSPSRSSFSPGRYKQSMFGSVLSVHSGEGGESEEVRGLRAEITELKNQIKVDQQLIAGISSNEMMQYIMKLEDEVAELHKRCNDTGAQLHATKVAHLALSQQLDRKPAATYASASMGM